MRGIVLNGVQGFGQLPNEVNLLQHSGCLASSPYFSVLSTLIVRSNVAGLFQLCVTKKCIHVYALCRFLKKYIID